MRLKFIKWFVDNRPTRSGDLLVKGEFVDERGRKYEWCPRLEDIQKGIGAVESAGAINKLHRRK